jgi:hypothetical protein
MYACGQYENETGNTKRRKGACVNYIIFDSIFRAVFAVGVVVIGVERDAMLALDKQVCTAIHTSAAEKEKKYDSIGKTLMA